MATLESSNKWFSWNNVLNVWLGVSTLYIILHAYITKKDVFSVKYHKNRVKLKHISSEIKINIHNMLPIVHCSHSFNTLLNKMGKRECRSAKWESPPYIAPAAMYIGVFDGYPREERKIPTSFGVNGQYPLSLCSCESISLTFQ